MKDIIFAIAGFVLSTTALSQTNNTPPTMMNNSYIAPSSPPVMNNMAPPQYRPFVPHHVPTNPFVNPNPKMNNH